MSNSRWFDILEDFYGVRLDQLKAQRWADHIKSQVSGANEAEIIEALKWSVSSFARNSKKARPDLAEVIQMIRAYRSDKFDTAAIPNRVKTYIGGQFGTTTMSELKFALRRCNDPVEAWEIICSPLDADQGRELHAYADEHDIAYERFVPDTNYDELSQTIVNQVEEEVPF